ncbi:hypothetical protein [Parasitella parasitica]|uniref:Uncharacterized protein n=1 Tax=Parasitella parasitica TaxID=35722 RepID=A0A0B7MXV3_9FUNG|nr:hypothetical protein [Parasitella parasitica]
MGLSSTSPSSSTHQHQTFIEEWLFKTSNQQNFENVNNEQKNDAVEAVDADISDSPPWASSCKSNSYWHSSTRSVGQQRKAEAAALAVVEHQYQINENESSYRSIPDSTDNNGEVEKNDGSPQFSTIDYSITATVNFMIPQPDEGDEEEEEITAEYKTALTTLEEYDEIEELCRPHPAPYFNQLFDTDSQDTIPYLEDEVDGGEDTQPYNVHDEDQDTQPYNPYEEDQDTQPYNADEEDQDTEPYDPDDEKQIPLDSFDTLPYSQNRLLEAPCGISKDDFALIMDMPDCADDSDYISPLASVHDAGDDYQNNNEYDISSPLMSLPSDKDEDVQEDFDDLTENDILQLEQEAVIKIKSTRKGKRRAASPIPVAFESQIVKLDKKQLRTSVVKKPTTLDDYFSHPSAINSQTGNDDIVLHGPIFLALIHYMIGQDIGKESSTPSFTLSSNEDMNKSQVDRRRRPRFGLSKKSS